ncbi:catecholate siderophore receptor [Pseudoduganella flava]|uniref:Catecholate siderophore receptor n=1 Tax=Pseudoduganella flava TaxID=871742 RepID=A0A562P6I6_9BURK|nr:catecholate siderophore receptor Fiu [Pseudoduganella flava]QGZ40009.1 catecholate siderophore receptor Fiu [Pseudoduganella flava]TWI39943.1 catecholate siderophore receptor [Pseudoduganella flava]
MAHIKSRKHSVLPVSTVLASLLLPAAAHAAGQQAEAKMTEVVVDAAKENDFKAERAGSPKYTELLVNTPQTITVIKKELFQQQNATTLTEALRNSPGVGTFFLGENGNTNTGDAIFLRGFDTSSSIFVDGVRDIGSISRDVFNIEQIDVLKGPAGTDTGRGSPTGSVNLNSKQANLENAISASVTGGSGSQKRATADVNRVLDAQSGTAFRLNVMAQDSGNPARDVVKNKRWGVAPTVAFGLGGKTRAHLSYLHIKQDNLPDGGVPTIGLPGYTTPDSTRPYISNAPMVDPRGYYGHVSDHDNVTADMATVRIEHDFSPTLRLQNISRYGKTKQDYLLTAFMGSSANLTTQTFGAKANDPATWLINRTLRTFKDAENRILANQTVVTWDVTTGALKHTVVGGLEFLNEKQTSYGRAGGGVLLATPLYFPAPDSSINGLNTYRTGAGSQGTTDTQALYVFDTVKIGEQWMVNAGVRMDHYDTDYISTALATGGGLTATTLSSNDTLTTGKLSVLYKPTANSSVYATVANSKQPPGGANFSLSTSASSAANPNMDPQETTTKEIGTKWDLLDQKLALTAAVYRTDVKNEVEFDASSNQYFQNGKKRVEGIELAVQGEILPGWLVSAGYTHMKTSVEVGRTVTASGENHLNYTPKDAFTSWTSYKFPFGLELGGGVRYTGKLLRGTDGAVGTPAYADSYWVADLMAAYQITKHIDLRLNVYNITDEQYVASINKSGYRYTPGAPRSASLTANFRF